jgi:putative Mn2+ efflux pump MntP
MDLVLYFSLDSFFAALALAMLLPSLPRVRILWILFGVCDGLATAAGARVGTDAIIARHSMVIWLTPALVVVWALFAGLLSWSIARRGHAPGNCYLWLPFILSVDNLFFGRASAPAHVSGLAAPILAGVMSALLAFAGAEVAKPFRRFVPRAIARAIGAILLALTPILA